MRAILDLLATRYGPESVREARAILSVSTIRARDGRPETHEAVRAAALRGLGSFASLRDELPMNAYSRAYCDAIRGGAVR